MSPLLDELLAQVLDRSEQVRIRARERLRAIGLPTARHEGWRYTPVRALLARGYANPSADAELPELPESLLDALEALEPDFIYVDGMLQEHEDEDGDDVDEFVEERFDNFEEPPAFDDPDLDTGRPYSRLHPEYLDDGFELANIAWNQGGLLLDIDGEDEDRDGEARDGDTIVIAYASTTEPGGFPHVRHRIRIGAGQHLTLIEQFLHEPGSQQAMNLGHEIELEAGARLDWIRIGDVGEGNQLLGFARLRVAEGAALHAYEITRGAALYRQATQVDLAGPGASCDAAIVASVDGRRHADLNWRVDHRARDTRAQLDIRGLADGRGKLACTGTLVVHPGADGTDTRLRNKNLLLSPHAEVNTRPILEIDADEVKAAHGATVGQLDERALFYLRARGLPEALAKQLLTRAFAFEVLAGVSPDLREGLEEALTELLAEPA